MVEHLVDVDRLARREGPVVEHFEAVDQGADAVGLVADELGERALVAAERRFQELGRAANARERIFHLVRQHGGHGRDRARGAAMGELAVDFLRDGLQVDRDHGRRRLFRDRRDLEVHGVVADARRLDRDAIFEHGLAGGEDLVEQAEDRAVGRQVMAEAAAAQLRQAGAEELLGRQIGEQDLAVGPNHDNGVGERVQHRPALDRHGDRRHRLRPTRKRRDALHLCPFDCTEFMQSIDCLSSGQYRCSAQSGQALLTRVKPGGRPRR